jgi:hypothetical protein
VVGRARDGDGNTDEAFIWTAATGMRSIRDVLVNDFGLNLTGWDLTFAQGISADGSTIVGWGNINDTQEAWVAVLPEPSIAGIVATAATGGAVLRRRRRA